MSGTATHFIIRVGSDNVGPVPVGFAVYAGTAGEQDPIGALLIRGYHAAYNFTAAGHYALPFTSAESIEIVAGTYYHLVYLLTPGDESAASGWRIANETAPPPKWYSDCTKAACDADAPPGVGGEFWNGQYWPTSAGWAMGLLDASGATPGDAAILADSSTPGDASEPADAAPPPADLAPSSDISSPADALPSPDDAHSADREAAPDGAAADSATNIDGAAPADSTPLTDGPMTDLDPQAPRAPALSEGCRCRVTGERAAPFPTLLSLAIILFLRRRIGRG